MFGVPKIVLERLRVKPTASRPAASGQRQIEHPDANLLTAYVEKTLTAGERTRVLDHLAECAECREVVALTLPAEVAVAEPARLPVAPRWNLAQAFRWGALAMALGAVIFILVLHTRSMKIKEMASKTALATAVASASKASPQRLAQPPAPAIPNAATTAAGAKSRESQRAMAMLRKHASPPRSRGIAAQSAGVESKAQAPMPAAARPPVVAGTIPAKTESVGVSTGLNTNLVGVASAPAPPQPQALIHSPERSGLTNSARAAEQMRAKALQATLTRMGFRNESQNVAVQPGALWTISSEGKLQRSGDGGKNWEAVRVDDQVTFRAIQTIGREIWAGGTGLALYHSRDGGLNWTRVNLSPAGAPTTEAIVSIDSSPSDIQHISVRTETGRQWTSEDGGQHWKSVTSEE